jgi:antitoxin HigA-1
MQPAESLISRADVDTGRVDLRDAVEPGTAIDGPIHPGEHLAEFLEEYGWSARELARRLAVPHNRVLAILAGKRSLSADTAMRLSRLFGTNPELWLNLQMRYDLDLLKASEAARIAREVWPVEHA